MTCRCLVYRVLYVISGGTSIVVGGTGTNAVWAYSPKTKTWSAIFEWLSGRSRPHRKNQELLAATMRKRGAL